MHQFVTNYNFFTKIIAENEKKKGNNAKKNLNISVQIYGYIFFFLKRGITNPILLDISFVVLHVFLLALIIINVFRNNSSFSSACETYRNIGYSSDEFLMQASKFNMPMIIRV